MPPNYEQWAKDARAEVQVIERAHLKNFVHVNLMQTIHEAFPTPYDLYIHHNTPTYGEYISYVPTCHILDPFLHAISPLYSLFIRWRGRVMLELE